MKLCEEICLEVLRKKQKILSGISFKKRHFNHDLLSANLRFFLFKCLLLFNSFSINTAVIWTWQFNAYFQSFPLVKFCTLYNEEWLLSPRIPSVLFWPFVSAFRFYFFIKIPQFFLSMLNSGSSLLNLNIVLL